MQNEKTYQPPLLEVVVFPEADVIRTSDMLEWDKEPKAFSNGWSSNAGLFN